VLSRMLMSSGHGREEGHGQGGELHREFDDGSDEMSIVRKAFCTMSLSNQCFPNPITIFFNECDLRCMVVGPW
jgi:hypothetical protein